MSWLRGVAGLALVLVAAVGVVYWMGSRLPLEHRAVATGRVEASQSVVWKLVTDTATQTAWREGLAKVEFLSGEEHCWVETQQSMKIAFCTVREVPENLRVVRVKGQADFGGRWTYALEPLGAGATEVTITEDGFVKSPLWRFMGHYMMGEETNVKQFLRDLQAEAVRQR